MGMMGLVLWRWVLIRTVALLHLDLNKLDNLLLSFHYSPSKQLVFLVIFRERERGEIRGVGG
jgi:hypothetical protein